MVPHSALIVELKELVISIGGIDRSRFNDPVWEHFKIAKAVCHPEYFSMTEENDICLLKLSKPSTKQVCGIFSYCFAFDFCVLSMRLCH